MNIVSPNLKYVLRNNSFNISPLYQYLYKHTLPYLYYHKAWFFTTIKIPLSPTTIVRFSSVGIKFSIENIFLLLENFCGELPLQFSFLRNSFSIENHSFNYENFCDKSPLWFSVFIFSFSREYKFSLFENFSRKTSLLFSFSIILFSMENHLRILENSVHLQ